MPKTTPTALPAAEAREHSCLLWESVPSADREAVVMHMQTHAEPRSGPRHGIAPENGQAAARERSLLAVDQHNFCAAAYLQSDTI